MKWDSCVYCKFTYPLPCKLHDKTKHSWHAGRYSGSAKMKWWICRYCGAGESFFGTVNEERKRAMAHEAEHTSGKAT